jgi:hypothetical protein
LVGKGKQYKKQRQRQQRHERRCPSKEIQPAVGLSSSPLEVFEELKQVVEDLAIIIQRCNRRRDEDEIMLLKKIHPEEFSALVSVFCLDLETEISHRCFYQWKQRPIYHDHRDPSEREVVEKRISVYMKLNCVFGNKSRTEKFIYLRCSFNALHMRITFWSLSVGPQIQPPSSMAM